MRGYEKVEVELGEFPDMRYESPCGVMSLQSPNSTDTNNELRIPMRGYEVLLGKWKKWA